MSTMHAIITIDLLCYINFSFFTKYHGSLPCKFTFCTFVSQFTIIYVLRQTEKC